MWKPSSSLDGLYFIWYKSASRKPCGHGGYRKNKTIIFRQAPSFHHQPIYLSPNKPIRKHISLNHWKWVSRSTGLLGVYLRTWDLHVWLDIRFIDKIHKMRSISAPTCPGGALPRFLYIRVCHFEIWDPTVVYAGPYMPTFFYLFFDPPKSSGNGFESLQL